MSKKTVLNHRVRTAAKNGGGAHLTRTGRIGTGKRLARLILAEFPEVRDISSLGIRHIDAYFIERAKDGIAIRTMQNESSDLRVILRASGRGELAENPAISNKALGISGGCRGGKKTAISTPEFVTLVGLAQQIDPGLASIFGLQLTLGLRSQEGIRSGASLASWETQLTESSTAHVIFGTKGGRERHAVAPDVEAALAAVRAAQIVAESRGGKLLNGTLKQASTFFRNVCHRTLGIQSHRHRYRYRDDLMLHYTKLGYSKKECRALVSISMGHGDGRGRYVERVYGCNADSGAAPGGEVRPTCAPKAVPQNESLNDGAVPEAKTESVTYDKS